MKTLVRIARWYAGTVDAAIRLAGTCMIAALLFAALGMLLHFVNWLWFGAFAAGPLHLWLGLIFAPPLLRLAVLGGGFTIPPLSRRAGSPAKPLDNGR